MVARCLKLALPFIWAALLYNISVADMPPQAWCIFIVFSSTIISIMLRTFPIAVAALLGLTISVSLGILDIKNQAFSGFGVPTVWLVGFVFFIAKGFINSRLGERIAYCFIMMAGKTPLRLAYALLLSEVICAPFIPSSTARAGGISLPILQSINTLFEGETHKESRIMSFLTQVVFHANIICSSLFLTGMVSNPLAQSLAHQIGVDFGWIDWFKIACVPGVLCLLLAPLIVFWKEKPTLKNSEAIQNMARQKLSDLGTISWKEIKMMIILVLMLTLWIFGDRFGIASASVALLGLLLCLVTRIINFDEVLSETKAWETMLWLSILITMSMALKEYGFIEVLTYRMQECISGKSTIIALLGILTFYYWSGYFFASNSAHVSALYISFLGVVISLGISPILAGVVLTVFSGLYSSGTHYGSTSGSILFSAGFVSMKTWWSIGFIIALVNFLIWLTLGPCWWHFLGTL